MIGGIEDLTRKNKILLFGKSKEGHIHVVALQIPGFDAK